MKDKKCIVKDCRNKISQGLIGKTGRQGASHSQARKVNQYSLDGMILKTYSYTKEAAIENKLDPATITKCCRGKRKTTGGFIWKYA